MNKTTTITAVIILCVYLLLLVSIFWNKNMYNAVIAGSLGTCAGVFMVITGFIISLIKKSKYLGLALWLVVH